MSTSIDETFSDIVKEGRSSLLAAGSNLEYNAIDDEASSISAMAGTSATLLGASIAVLEIVGKSTKQLGYVGIAASIVGGLQLFHSKYLGRKTEKTIEY